MLRLHLVALNDDLTSVREDAVELLYAVSSGPQKYTVVVMDSGTSINVTESVETIENALNFLKARKASSETQS